jgi:molecular chaperone IbpA
LFDSQFFLGFNEQVARWESLSTVAKKATFPPYNLIKEDDENQRIELAVAGYSKEDIDISVKVDLLTIKGYKKDEDSNSEIIHQGIAGREWKQEFVLGEWITVKEASLKDGLLTIRLVRELPEEMKPKVISIQ